MKQSTKLFTAALVLGTLTFVILLGAPGMFKIVAIGPGCLSFYATLFGLFHLSDGE